jgi:hypothetical protein
MSHAEYLRIEDAVQRSSPPWTKLRRYATDATTVIASFTDLSEEETDIRIAELLMTGR